VYVFKNQHDDDNDMHSKLSLDTREMDWRCRFYKHGRGFYSFRFVYISQHCHITRRSYSSNSSRLQTPRATSQPSSIGHDSWWTKASQTQAVQLSQHVAMSAVCYSFTFSFSATLRGASISRITPPDSPSTAYGQLSAEYTIVLE